VTIPPPALSRVGYDRAVEHRTDDAWLAAAWERALVLEVAADGTVAIRQTDEGVRLDLRPAVEVTDTGLLRVFLGVNGDTPYFGLVDVATDSDVGFADRVDPDQARAGLRALGAELDDIGSGLLTSAIALRNYHARHPRCPRCGTQTDVIQAGWARRCPADGTDHFPRTDPAVIMLVHDGGDRCVLGRQAV